MLYACGGQAGQTFGSSLVSLDSTTIANDAARLAALDLQANMKAEQHPSKPDDKIQALSPFQAALEPLSFSSLLPDAVSAKHVCF